MSEEMLVQYCAPTLAGLKTGSLFGCPYSDRKALTQELRRLNRQLGPSGLCLLPLRYSEKRALLYLFRPSQLQRDLQGRSAAELLRQAGYENLNAGQCVKRLMQRLKQSEDFPHEIGLFLSYPPEDVRGFMENHAQNSKLTGYWKVYGDVAAARKTFERYKKCTDCYCRLLRAGCALDRLAVAV